MDNNCIIEWELYHNVQYQKKIIKICTGIGLNMLFPEYITIDLNPKIEQEIINPIKNETPRPKTPPKN